MITNIEVKAYDWIAHNSREVNRSTNIRERIDNSSKNVLEKIRTVAAIYLVVIQTALFLHFILFSA